MIDFSPLIEALKDTYATDYEIEERIGIAHGSISRIRHGKRLPKLSVVYEIGRLLNIPIEKMMIYRNEQGDAPSDVDVKYLASPAIISTEAARRPPKPKKMIEPDFTQAVIVFESKFQEHYPNIPKDYQDYLEFVGRAYKQGCRDTFRKMAAEMEEKEGK